MNDAFLKSSFQLSGLSEPDIDKNETRRIQSTLALIPETWKSLIDVGCGDGRISNQLVDRGIEVSGIDWAGERLKHFKGKTIVGDIREPWLINNIVDGIICAEVLEHLAQEDIDLVIANIKNNSRKGFIISVPAREQLNVHMGSCIHCGKRYHIWGHRHRFNEFEDVDAMVGQRSTKRVFVPYDGISPSESIYRWRCFLGHYPYSQFSICPFCGTEQVPPSKPPFVKLALLWLLAKLEKKTTFLRPRTGWFICRYDK